MPNEPWLQAWFSLLSAEALQGINQEEVAAVLDLLATNTLRQRPSQR